jgi:serine phosphatase RsbU (regulator of sigma subunit)
MERSGSEGWPGLSRLLRSPSARFAAPLAALAALLAIDDLTGPDIRIGGLMVAVPALSAVFLVPYAVLVVAVVTVGCVVLAALGNNTISTDNFPVVVTTVVLIGAASVMAAVLRQRRERELAQVREVAAVTQRALLRPMPQRLGRVTISSMYLAAAEEAAIGGDLYAAAATHEGTARVLVGDVQGKGLAAVEVAGLLMSAFRRAVHAGIALAGLPGFLDTALREDLADLAANGEPTDDPIGDPPPGSAQPVEPRFMEGFVTAVVIDIADDGGTVRIANCGHPPPLLIHGGTVEQLMPGVPDLPLGLGDLTRQDQHIDTHGLAVGDILLLYTDGVIEARDGDGVFYPLADRLAEWTADTPAVLLETIKADLLRHADTRLADDVALVAVQRVA